MAKADDTVEEKQDKKAESQAEQKSADRSARKKRGRKNIAEGVVHIHSTFNNTIVTITDYQGNVISWSSAGSMGFKGSRKGTPFAAQQAADSAAKKAMDHGLRSVQIFVRGPGAGRESALRALQSAGIQHQPDKRCNPDSPQRVPSAKTKASLIRRKDWLDTQNLCAGFAGVRTLSSFLKGSDVTRTSVPLRGATIRRASMVRSGPNSLNTAFSCARNKRSNECTA